MEDPLRTIYDLLLKRPQHFESGRAEKDSNEWEKLKQKMSVFKSEDRLKLLELLKNYHQAHFFISFKFRDTFLWSCAGPRLVNPNKLFSL